MHSVLLLTHSVLRYFVLIFLLMVIVRSLMGWQNKGEYTSTDNKLGTWLMMLTHTQFLIGLVLYFVSPLVIFSGAAMKEPVTRYWLVEHSVMMLMAVGLITAGRATAKRLSDSVAKHKRMFIFNAIALLIIIVAIASFKDRGFFTITM
jgi:hypothetical protein